MFRTCFPPTSSDNNKHKIISHRRCNFHGLCIILPIKKSEDTKIFIGRILFDLTSLESCPSLFFGQHLNMFLILQLGILPARLLT